MKVKIKFLNDDVRAPEYAHEGDGAMDLVATSMNQYPNYIEYGTGICLGIPVGYVGLIFPRSSLSNYDLTMCNSVGIIDSTYSGEVKFRFKQTKLNDQKQKHYKPGDKIGQLMIVPYPAVEFEEVESLQASARGAGGFGSTGQ